MKGVTGRSGRTSNGSSGYQTGDSAAPAVEEDWRLCVCAPVWVCVRVCGRSYVLCPVLVYNYLRVADAGTAGTQEKHRKWTVWEKFGHKSSKSPTGPDLVSPDDPSPPELPQRIS